MRWALCGDEGAAFRRRWLWFFKFQRLRRRHLDIRRANGALIRSRPTGRLKRCERRRACAGSWEVIKQPSSRALCALTPARHAMHRLSVVIAKIT